jgi:ferric-dicitrate binding protein FerR (iron transport regulator)
MKRQQATRAHDYQRAMRRRELVEGAKTALLAGTIALLMWGTIFALLIIGSRP